MHFKQLLITIMAAFSFILGTLVIPDIKINAATIISMEQAYQNGILSGKINPSYCSKMVWQAFWFGTGNKKVATGTPAFITPKSLPNYFYKAYAPYKVGSY
ncbi:hypothetical protein ACLJJ6_00590 [Pediococcus siamensis]|uniref:hypothetical protein n=1 Tax=Pediococcus siamensis TaxID=381829 RepID=UPI0039A1D64C